MTSYYSAYTIDQLWSILSTVERISMARPVSYDSKTGTFLDPVANSCNIAGNAIIREINRKKQARLKNS